MIDPAYVANIIQERSQRRRMIELGERIQQRAYESTDDLDAQLRRTEEELGHVLGRGPKAETGYQFMPGGNFVLDTDPVPQALWGDGDQVLWADGEALIIAGAQGLGKTTLVQQLALGWLGFDKYAESARLPDRAGHAGAVPRDGPAAPGGQIIPAHGHRRPA